MEKQWTKLELDDLSYVTGAELVHCAIAKPYLPMVGGTGLNIAGFYATV